MLSTMTSWEDYVDGYMERGQTYASAEIARAWPIEETSRMSWGLVFVTGNLDAVLDAYDVVDTIDANTVCIKLLKTPVIVNEGPTPCYSSQAELKPPPSGKWFHFKEKEAREQVHTRLNELQSLDPNLRLHYVLDMFPLKLARWMSSEEAKEYLKDAIEHFRKRKAAQDVPAGTV